MRRVAPCRAPRRPFSACRAFTLVELLAVIVVLAIATGVMIVSVGGIAETATFESVRGSIFDLDLRARLLARTGHVVMLEEGGTRGGVILRTEKETAPIARVSAPAGVTLTLRVDHTDRPSIIFDLRGRASDYIVALTSGSRSETWSVSGLTGCAHRVDGGIDR